MTWFKVDDSFHSHPKVLATDADALGLWVVAGAWSSANLTDGFVPDHVLSRLLPGAADLARKLITAGLWKRSKGGHQFHDWGDFQPASAEVRAMRDKRARAGRLGGLASGRTRAHSKSEGSRDLAVTKNDGYSNVSGYQNSASGNRAESDSQWPDQGNERSKGGSKNEARASRIVEPPTRPDPTFMGGPGSSPTYDRPGLRSEPPLPRCEDHAGVNDPPPCGACGDARRARTRWELTNAERLRNAPKCRIHRGQLAHNCALCRADQLAAIDEEAS